MKSVKTFLIIAALTVSSLAMAEGGSDRVFERMEAARQNSMQAYQVAQTQGTQPPVAESKTKEMDHKNC
ncbi:co-regulatory protein PtrA N-terminal domain-containing protein [Pseudomonas helvetica]|uniref:co-regulatory protein PtrA N-terminal domain-containing protein n=1 Tax=Pseudomonas helvetica TaxID=3136738 RepID=UPI003264241E